MKKIVASYDLYEEFSDIMRDFLSQPSYAKKVKALCGEEVHNIPSHAMWDFIYNNEKWTLEFIDYCLTP